MARDWVEKNDRATVDSDSHFK